MKNLNEHSKKNVMALIQFVVKEYHLAPEKHSLDGFSEACYRDNSIDQLLKALQRKKADRDDCRAWDLQPVVWRREIKKALELMLFETLEEVGN